MEKLENSTHMVLRILKYFAKVGNVKIISSLINSGISPELKDKSGKNISFLALNYQNEEITEFLGKKGYKAKATPEQFLGLLLPIIKSDNATRLLKYVTIGLIDAHKII